MTKYAKTENSLFYNEEQGLLSFVTAYLRLKDVNRKELAKRINYTLGGLNAFFNKCDNIGMATMYNIFEAIGAELEVELRRPEDPPMIAAQYIYPKEERPVAALKVAIERYKVSRQALANEMGVSYRMLVYIFQNNNISFTRLYEFAKVMGLSIFINIIEKGSELTKDNERKPALYVTTTIQDAKPLPEEMLKKRGPKKKGDGADTDKPEEKADTPPKRKPGRPKKTETK